MNTTRFSFHLEGMTCAGCAAKIETALTKAAGVAFASVNLATATGFVSGDETLTIEELALAVRRTGYRLAVTADPDREQKRFRETRRRFRLAWLAAGPLMLLMGLHMAGLHLPQYAIVELALATLTLLVAGPPVMRGAFVALRHAHTNMDTLIMLGALTAWATGILALAGLPIASFAAGGAMVLAVHASGRFLESRMRDAAVRELSALLRLQPAEARLVRDGDEPLLVPVAALAPGSRFLVHAGERFPADGRILEGSSAVDESLLTGEPLPVARAAGGTVTGGSLNLAAPLLVEATRTGQDSFLARMLALVTSAQGTKIPLQALADRITRVFVPGVVLVAIAAALAWYFATDTLAPLAESFSSIFPWIVQSAEPLTRAALAAVSTLVIACPCALGLAIPIALVNANVVAARSGLVVRNAEAIQTLARIKVAALDKTGTLTVGQPRVVGCTLVAADLALAGALARRSSHPLSRAIARYAGPETADPGITDIRETPGSGVSAVISGETWFLGKAGDPAVYNEETALGRTIVELRRGAIVSGALSLADELRADSPAAIRRLAALGVSTVMLSGDAPQAAARVAASCGITQAHGGLSPEVKLEEARRLRETFGPVMMVGDGINDAAALKGADVGVAIGSGSDLAIDNADLVIVRGGLPRLADAILLAARTVRVIKQNLFWAFAYNLLALPAAALGLLHPVIAEAAMAASSLTVLANAARLRKTTFPPEAAASGPALTLSIPAISCKKCVARVSRVVQQAGYDRFTVDLKAKTVTVPGGERNTLTALLAEAGYAASKPEETGAAT